MKAKKQRLDVALVERALVETRSKAQSLIMARRITVGGVIADKPGIAVAADDVVVVVALEHPWVGRGGMKLAQALKEFALDVTGSVCADIGASTGGFTHVLLENGAAKVYAIDVGHGQIDQGIRNDPRVVNREHTNARFLQTGNFEERIDFVCIDVSFISLKMILPVLPRFAREGANVVALIKPQFEVGRADVGKGGIVRDEAKRAQAVEGVLAAARELGLDVRGVIESPVKGAEGNVEYLMHAVICGASTRES
jgi:23S rRNA (cytidine1920-2'-O)/16S rRNA (cytidine1409-2'-O)-methyltransferase